MNPAVSIITPTYNHEPFIGGCIRSVLAQTFTDWEMIIIDDGSTDGTWQVVLSFAQDERRLIPMTQENKGLGRLSETYNKALSMASGEWIGILEGDDLWEPDKLARQMESLDKNPDTVMSWGRAEAFYPGRETPGEILPAVVHDRFFNRPPGAVLDMLLMENPIPAVTALIRRRTLEEIGGFRQGYGLPLVDLPTWLALSGKGPFYFDDRVLGRWRIYESQATRTYPVEILTGRRKLCLDYFDGLSSSAREDVTWRREDLLKHYRKQELVAYARSGRYKLIRKDFKGARSDYRKAMFSGSAGKPAWRLRSLTGYFFSLFHRDVEGLSKLMGKKTYRSS